MSDIFQNFTTHSKNALKNAFGFALSVGDKSVTPAHILYGLSQETGSIACQILAKAKLDSAQIKKALGRDQALAPAIREIGLAPAARKILEKSFLLASLNRHKYIGTEHLLASLISVRDALTAEILRKKAVDLDEIQRQIETVLESTSKFPGLNETYSPPDGLNAAAGPALADQPSILEFFAVNLTDADCQKKIDPVIGREPEIERLIQILCRRHKNNPLLLGDPGVGKTAIVEGLAKKITQGEVPQILADKAIYTLDLSLVVAGTSFRGEFENRLKQILQEIKKNPNLILFIDEIHNLVSAGAAAGSMDAANILKPALARGEIRCIGATTLDSYKKYIEADPALERRFQPIMVSQPTVEKTREILRGLKGNYEQFHQVTISEAAIKAAAELADKYITDRFLPDKAIDLIDEAAAAAKIKNFSGLPAGEINNLQNQLKNIRQKKQEAIMEEKFDLALKCRRAEQEISDKLEGLLSAQKNQKPSLAAEINDKDIAEIVAQATGIPAAELLAEEKNRLLKLEKILEEKIIGQRQALTAVAEFIRRARTGVTDSRRPLGSFLFLGPSGVGKTELAKVLAEAVFGSTEALVKIDMSEFAESFNISKLIGAPAGYVGYKEGAKLTDAVFRRPYSVVLFDEVEKAHPQVFGLLLQILEDGFLADGTGKAVNFRQALIILTSNLGSESFSGQAAVGFQAVKQNSFSKPAPEIEQIEQEVLKKLKEKFPPEFLSRIDKTIVFKPLTETAVEKIARLQLAELSARLAKQGYVVEMSPAVAKTLAKLSFTPQDGARAIRKNIQDIIENKIAKIILEKPESRKEKIVVKTANNKIII